MRPNRRGDAVETLTVIPQHAHDRGALLVARDAVGVLPRLDTTEAPVAAVHAPVERPPYETRHAAAAGDETDHDHRSRRFHVHTAANLSQPALRGTLNPQW